MANCRWAAPGARTCGERCNDDSPRGAPSRARLALNCVTPETAAALCACEGRRLPTEAEWEWAGGSREERRLYAWGDETVSCPLPGTNDPREYCGEPYDSDLPAGQATVFDVGAQPGDWTVDGVADMSGGVSEWVADAFETYAEPCWQPGRYDTDPVCTSSAALARPYGRSRRGTNVLEGGSGNFTTTGRHAASPEPAIETGFRCARDGQ